jgi:peptidoglycan/xylan/chitin deacetylase (PgdA/CDA1 family)
MWSRQRLVYLAKRAAARVLYTLGVLQVWQAVALRQRAVVLMYHRVLTPEERERAASHPALVVERDTFARQMALLKKRFVVLSVAELAEYLEQRRPLPSSSCVITFDDGWRDNYDNALPILAKLELPSLIFLPINYIGQRRVFWQEALVQLLGRAVGEVRAAPARRAVIEPILAPVGLSSVLDVSEPDPRPAIVAAVSTRKSLARERVEGLIAALAASVGVNVEELAATDGFIGWTEVQAMSRQRVTFGGHGVDHLLLTQVSDEEADAEVMGSKIELDQRVGEAVPTFSYPNGYYTPRVAAKARSAGYRLAFIAEGGWVTCDDDRWTVRRLNIAQAGTDTEPLFLARVVGLL